MTASCDGSTKPTIEVASIEETTVGFDVEVSFPPGTETFTLPGAEVEDVESTSSGGGTTVRELSEPEPVDSSVKMEQSLVAVIATDDERQNVEQTVTISIDVEPIP